MSEHDDLYASLGLTREATADEIARAYERLRPSPSVTNAYDMLRDATRRRAYDDTRATRAGAASAAATFHHLAPAGDADIELPLTFDQAALGTTANLQVDSQEPCSSCAGTGVTATEALVCPDCAGAGSHKRQPGQITIRYRCGTCDGSGRQPPQPCGHCGGGGTVAVVRDVTLRVPAGVTDGTRLRFHVRGREGEQPRFATVRSAPHPYFARSGPHVTLRLPISLAEAALGAVVPVPTLGGALAMRIPPGTPHGRTFRIGGQGIPGPAGSGDLLVTVEVVIPTELNEAQRRALEAFAAAAPSPRAHLESPAPPAAGRS